MDKTLSPLTTDRLRQLVACGTFEEKAIAGALLEIAQKLDSRPSEDTQSICPLCKIARHLESNGQCTPCNVAESRHSGGTQP
jgi:hypothetical protein